jgi:uncharacterized protein (TIGR00297 family)
MNDHEVLFVLGPIVLLLAIAAEVAWRNRLIPQWVARKILHVGAVGACAIAPLWLEDLVLLKWIVIGSEALLLWLVHKGYFYDQRNSRRSWGVVLFPLPYLLLLHFETERWLIALPMAILALSDAMAAATGNLYGQGRYSLTGDPKTMAGSIGFFVTTVILLLALPYWHGLTVELPAFHRWSLLVVIALLITAVEALGSRGLDNFFIPLVAWALFGELAAMPVAIRAEVALELGVALVPALIFMVVSTRLKWLTPGGAVTAALTGVWVLFFAGLDWLLPLFLFLIAGSVATRVLRSRVPAADRKNGRPRDAVQVLCNGGIFALAAAVLDHPVAAIAMSVSVAISASDTLASEIGMAFRTKTRDVLNWRLVPPGLSGGVSLPGTMGALSGAFLFGLVGARLLHVMDVFWPLVILITTGGMLGMLLDSVLGSALQPRYRLADGTLSDVAGPNAVRISGRHWMSNDLVNLIGNAVVTGLIVVLLEVLHGMRHQFGSLF